MRSGNDTSQHPEVRRLSCGGKVHLKVRTGLYLLWSQRTVQILRQGRQVHGPQTSVRAYLYIDQLVEVTPWSASAIRTMIARGTFRQGVHYFKPHGPGGRPIFSWQAIVKYIEGLEVAEEEIPFANGRVVKLDEIAKEAQRLLRRGT